MIKKLIYLFCGTLVLTACGNSIEKKANEKLVIAKAAYVLPTNVATTKKQNLKSTVSKFCIRKHSKRVKPVRN